MTKDDTADVEEAQPTSDFTIPKHESRKKPIVHPSAQAPLPKDYGACLEVFYGICALCILLFKSYDASLGNYIIIR